MNGPVKVCITLILLIKQECDTVISDWVLNPRSKVTGFGHCSEVYVKKVVGFFSNKQKCLLKIERLPYFRNT